MADELLDVNVSMGFKGLPVLDDLRFKVYENEILVITGPSGCGKTTLINIIAGLLKPTSGQVTLRGLTLDPKVHNIAYVFQEPSCLPWRTIGRDVSIGLEIKGTDRKTIRKKRKEAMDLVLLEGYEEYYPWKISGGMKQRVAIARAYATNPDLLIMDEPFGQLDAQTRYLMQFELMRIWEKEKKTIILITHNIEEAVFLATRILLLSKQPTSIKKEYVMDLPRPRNFTDHEFLKIRGEIIDYLETFEEPFE